jgi:hypothetical protein
MRPRRFRLRFRGSRGGRLRRRGRPNGRHSGRSRLRARRRRRRRGGLRTRKLRKAAIRLRRATRRRAARRKEGAPIVGVEEHRHVTVRDRPLPTSPTGRIVPALFDASDSPITTVSSLIEMVLNLLDFWGSGGRGGPFYSFLSEGQQTIVHKPIESPIHPVRVLNT